MSLIIIITDCGSILKFNSNNMATPEYIEVTDIILIPDELTLAAGESEQLIADFVPPHTTVRGN